VAITYGVAIMLLTVEEGQAQIKALGSVAISNNSRLQAELAIAQERLHQALTREKPATKSRKVFSSLYHPGRLTNCSPCTRRTGITEAQTTH